MRKSVSHIVSKKDISRYSLVLRENLIRMGYSAQDYRAIRKNPNFFRNVTFARVEDVVSNFNDLPARFKRVYIAQLSDEYFEQEG